MTYWQLVLILLYRPSCPAVFSNHISLPRLKGYDHSATSPPPPPKSLYSTFHFNFVYIPYANLNSFMRPIGLNIVFPYNIQQSRLCTYKGNIKARSRVYFCREKAGRIIYADCVSADLLIQHAMRMRRIILPSVVWFNHTCPHYLIDGTIFWRRKKVTGHKMRVLIFSTTLAWNISHSKKNWEIFS